MAGIDAIKEKILEDAKIKARDIIDRAQKHADEINKNTQDEIEEEMGKIIESARKEALQKKERIIAAQHLEGKKMILSVKQNIINKAIDMAVNNIINFDNEKYLKVMTGMALKAVFNKSSFIVLNKNDRERIGKELVDNINEALKEKGSKAKVVLSEETAEISGGFIIKSGDIEINNSLRAVVSHNKSELTQAAAKILFTEDMTV